MKNLKHILIVFTTIIFSFSCSKDDSKKSTPFLEENPLQQYLTTAGFINEYPSLDGFGNYELGFTFKPLVNGKINSIVIKLPDARDNIRVTIWDLETEAILFEDNFDITTTDIDTLFEINSVSLVSSKEYVISMNTDSYYINSANLFNPVEADYPIIIGNISILNARSDSGTNQVLPTTISTLVYSGNCSFNFQRTE